MLLLLACAGGPYTVVLKVVGEHQEPLADATAQVDGDTYSADSEGNIRIPGLLHPVMLTVRADRHLPEPVVVRREDAETVQVAMVEDGGGSRRVLHTAGDVMLGRRYEAPTEGEPLITPGDGGASAAKVVSDAVSAFNLADLRILNLETTVGDFSLEEAYPGKRFLVLTPPDALAALQSLQVDLAGLANNHQRDWLDDGLASTLQHLDDHKIPHLGAGMDAVSAAVSRRLDLDGFSVAVLAFTSVDGSYVNDQYPADDVPEPADVPEADRWQWETRSWGESALGVPVADRRIGGAWAALEEAEKDLPEEDQNRLWASATAVYPELQDWVARRGHGGANAWDQDASPAAVTAARQTADLVVVQLHMGFQFAEARGGAVEEAAHAAVDAGADLVIAHHPHVLQGLEWYKGHLIAWSAGNFVFDQDFLSTFRSAFVRTIWEADGTLVQARLVPLFLDQYRPVPTAGWLAEDTLRGLWAGSVLDAQAQRGADLGVRSVNTGRATGAEAPTFVLEHGTARLLPGLPEPETVRVDVPTRGLAAVTAPLSSFVGGTAGVMVGRSVFGLGHFEDSDTDQNKDDTQGWVWDSPDVSISPMGYIQLLRRAGSTSRVSARTQARVPLRAHRLYDDADGNLPSDGNATWSVVLRHRSSGETDLGSLRLVLYHFDDLNPTEDPESTQLRELDLKIPTTRDWTVTELALTEEDLAPVNGLTANAMLLYLSQNAPRTWESRLEVDDLEIVEWRDAAKEPSGFSAVDYLKSSDGRAHEVELGVLDW